MNTGAVAALFWKKWISLRSVGSIGFPASVKRFPVRGTAINLCGVDDPEASFTASADPARDTVSFLQQIDQVRKASENGNYTILLSHRPEFFELYAAQGFDLALCGHAHGGQFRIPGILNGFTPRIRASFQSTLAANTIRSAP